MKNKLLGSITLSVILFLVAPTLFSYLGWLLGTTRIVLYLLIFVSVILALSLIIWLFKNRRKISLPTFVSRLIIIISLVTNTVLFDGKFPYGSYDAYGECLFDAEYPSALYSKTGKLIDHTRHHNSEYYGEDRGNSGFGGLYSLRKAGIINSVGGPYFWFKKSITNELYYEGDEYTNYDLTYLVTLYSKNGEVIDKEEFHVEYGYSSNRNKYYYEGREVSASECSRQILHTLESDIEHHISYMTKNRIKTIQRKYF